MVFFRIRWIRRLMKRALPNMNESTAEKWHTRLSFLYFFFAWNTLGVIMYNVKKGKFDYAEYYGLKTQQEAERSKAETTMESLGIHKARIITFQGLTKVRDTEYENTLLEEQTQDREEELAELMKYKNN